MSAYPSSPSTFAMRYTPAAALEEQLNNAALLASSGSIPLPPSQSTTPSPEALQNRRANIQSHASNAFPPSPTPLKAQPSQSHSLYSTYSTPSSLASSPQQPPSLTRLSIPSSTPSPQTLPTTEHDPYTSFIHAGDSPVSQVSSTYSPPHLPPTHHTHHSHHHRTHTRNISSISALSPFDTTFITHHPVPLTPGNNPPGYVQNTRDSFEDRPVADVEEQTYSLPRSPLRQSLQSFPQHNSASDSPFYSSPNNHSYRKSYAGPGPGILNGEIFLPRSIDEQMGLDRLDGGYAASARLYGEDDGSEVGVWGKAEKWARTAYKKLGEAEEGVWKAVNR